MTRTKVYSSALDKSIEVDRIIGLIKGASPGPTLIFMSGIHGNEPAGVFALKRVLSQLEKVKIKGNFYAVAGNLSALNQGIRFHKEDLNRVWTKERMKRLGDEEDRANQDVEEQIQINALIQKILRTEKGPFYFFDMHTTSSETPPFLTVNDSLLNRNFTAQYPLPTILGIEEYLEGPILSYMNELGYVAFGFEAGQHDEMGSIENCVSFIFLSMIYAGTLRKDQVDYYKYRDSLAKYTSEKKYIFEIIYRYLIEEGEEFSMEPGFYNFQKIKVNQHLANSNGKPIKATDDGRIFMPLYQPQGLDGYFTIRQIWKPLLRLSAFIRKYRLDRMLVFLPGVKWLDKKKSGLMVNKQIARFMAKDLFHLFGYRSVSIDQNHLKMFNREASSRFSEYSGAKWLN